MYNLTKCALCGNEAELELSHTVPKMAVRTLKKTAIGNIRSTENPNKTIQDSGCRPPHWWSAHPEWSWPSTIPA